MVNHKVMSYLNVNDIKSDEAGVYKCRVDFKSAPTRNYNVNVTVIGESFHLNEHIGSFSLGVEVIFII